MLVALSMAIPAFAQIISTTTPPVPTPLPRDVAVRMCVAVAVDKRENAIIAAFDAFSISVKSAYMARRDALNALWQSAPVPPDQRPADQRPDVPYRAFRNAARTAKMAWNKSRIAAWRQFSIERRACGARPTGEDIAVDTILF